MKKKKLTRESLDEFLDNRARPEVAFAMREGEPMSEQEVLEALAENVRLGYVKKVGRDRYTLTAAGKKYVEQNLLIPLQ